MFSCFGFQVFLILSLEMPYSSVQKAFCVLEYAKTQSFKTVQRAFAQRFERFGLRPSAHKRSGIEAENFFSVRDCYRRHAAASLG